MIPGLGNDTMSGRTAIDLHEAGSSSLLFVPFGMTRWQTDDWLEVKLPRTSDKE